MSKEKTSFRLREKLVEDAFSFSTEVQQRRLRDLGLEMWAAYAMWTDEHPVEDQDGTTHNPYREEDEAQGRVYLPYRRCLDAVCREIADDSVSCVRSEIRTDGYAMSIGEWVRFK